MGPAHARARLTRQRRSGVGADGTPLPGRRTHDLYWGQEYGGTPEIGLIAALFGIVGSSVLALKLVPLTLYAVAAVLVWRIGRRTIGEPGATVAGLLVWLSPAYFLWRSAHEYGFYGVLLVCALSVILLALRLRERPTILDAAGLSLALGLGWWSSLQTGLVALPTIVRLVWRRPAVVRLLPVIAAAALLTLTPWLVVNVQSGWASLDPNPAEGHGDTYWSRLSGFFSHGLRPHSDSGSS